MFLIFLLVFLFGFPFIRKHMDKHEVKFGYIFAKNVTLVYGIWIVCVTFISLKTENLAGVVFFLLPFALCRTAVVSFAIGWALASLFSLELGKQAVLKVRRVNYKKFIITLLILIAGIVFFFDIIIGLLKGSVHYIPNILK